MPAAPPDIMQADPTQVSETPAPLTEVVQVAAAARIESVRRLGGLLGSTPRLPAPRPGMQMYLTADHPTGRKLVPAQPSALSSSSPPLLPSSPPSLSSPSPLLPPPSSLAHPWSLFVRTDPWPLMLTLSHSKTDAAGHAWDLVLHGTWAIADAPAFLREIALPQIAPESPLSGSQVQAWSLARVEPLARDAIATRTLEQLRDEQALTPKWWQQELCAALRSSGLTATVTRAEWYSASAAAAEAKELSRRHAAEAEEQRRQQAESELRRHEEEAEFDRRHAQIEADKVLSAEQRRAALEALEQERQLRQTEFENRRHEALRQRQQIDARYEMDLAAARAKAADERVARQKEADEQFRQQRRLASINEEQQLAAWRTQRETLEATHGAERARAEHEIAQLKHSEEQANKRRLQRQAEFDRRQQEAALRLDRLRIELTQATAEADAARTQSEARQQREAQTAAEETSRRARMDQELHHAKLKQVESDQTLTVQQRRLAIEREELDLAKARRAAAEADQAAAHAAEEHALRMQLMKAQLTYITDAARHNAEVGDKIDKFHAHAPAAKVAAMAADLSASDPRLAHQAAEFLTGDLGMRPQLLQAAGYNATRQMLVQTWQDKARRDGHLVRLTKENLTTRDIGIRVNNVLKIGSLLNFTVTSQRPGYVTVLNLGTSAKFWLLCPGSLCPPDRTRVEPNRPYALPGRELFPYPGTLAETGPAGKEHLVVFISDQPLTAALKLTAAQLTEPMNQLSAESLRNLTVALEATPNQWTAGVLSFDVE